MRLFNYFLIANGGQNIVSKDGKLHLDDPRCGKRRSRR